MIECFGLISIVFFDAMYDDIELSRSACARMMRSMLAVQPYSPVTRTHGDSVMRSLITTFSTLSPRISFISLELVKLLEVLRVLLDLAKELDALLDNVLLDHLEDLVLLQRLARDVERQVLRVDDALDKGQPLRDEVLAVVHDEDAADVPH